MSDCRMKTERIFALLLALLFTAAAGATAAMADDAEQLKKLPGQWLFSTEAEGADAGTDAAVLTLADDGSMSLLCRSRDGAYLCTFGGVWSSEFVPDDMDRLTLSFAATDHPAHAGGEYRAECVYRFYTESWLENDTEHTWLLLEDDGSSGVSPFAAVYGEENSWSLALHQERGPNMRVVNCRDFVSLRKARSKSSARIAKVPLGALVLAYPEDGEENGFIHCEYHGSYGYILKEYLEPVQ